MEKCPGQDTRYWGAHDISETACAACGYMVEFFKTDGSRRCPRCGTRVTNPKVSQGCAQWCQYAKECLGYDPKGLSEAERRNDSIAERLIAAVKREAGAEPERVSRALLRLEAAEEIMREEGGDPRVVITAALLFDIGTQDAEGAAARRILEEIGFEEEVIERVLGVLGGGQGGREPEGAEARVVWDAENIVKLPGRGVSGGEAPPDRLDADEVEHEVEKIFRTAKGKELARQALMGARKG